MTVGITFWHLYTAAALVMAVMLLRRLLQGPPIPPCAHQWEHVDKMEVPSKLDVIKRNGYQFGTPGQDSASVVGPYWLQACVVKTVLVVACKKCGEPKVIRESNS